MNILITNDDGIHAKGIEVLVELAQAFGDVYVVAPHENNSAVGHGITLRRAIKAQEVKLKGSIKSVAIDGTPADCVKYALFHLGLTPDIILSGINTERNCGTDIIYSGTVSAAIEANLCGYKAIALSATDENYEIVKEEFPTIFKTLMASSFDPKTTMNINFPNCSQSLGVKITTVGQTKYDVSYIEHEDGHLLTGPFVEIEQSEDTDIKAVLAGYVSITPLKFKLYDDNEINRLKKLFT